MSSRTLRISAVPAALLVASAFVLACDQSSGAPANSTKTPARAASLAPNPEPQPKPVAAPTQVIDAEHRVGPQGSTSEGSTAEVANRITFTGTREETERLVGYYKSIRLTPEQQRIKEQALSTIPAPCCTNNPLATCCCPCNLAKAAWGLSASLIVEHGLGVDAVRQAAQDWLAAAGPEGFSGDACYTAGCSRPIAANGCSGMNDRRVL